MVLDAGPEATGLVPPGPVGGSSTLLTRQREPGVGRGARHLRLGRVLVGHPVDVRRDRDVGVGGDAALDAARARRRSGSSRPGGRRSTATRRCPWHCASSPRASASPRAAQGRGHDQDDRRRVVLGLHDRAAGRGLHRRFVPRTRAARHPVTTAGRPRWGTMAPMTKGGPKRSAGLLVHRDGVAGTEVLLVHPGGTVLGHAGRGARGRSPRASSTTRPTTRSTVARREFREELGVEPPAGDPVGLGEVRLKSGKRVDGVGRWPGDLDVSAIESNHFETEWPPKSGRMASFPEVDRAEWCTVDRRARRSSTPRRSRSSTAWSRALCDRSVARGPLDAGERHPVGVLLVEGVEREAARTRARCGARSCSR